MEFLKSKFLFSLVNSSASPLREKLYTLKPMIQLLRLKHWSKSAFVFIGMIYSGAMIFLPDVLFAALAFSLLSSAIYVYNDLQDREADRAHPHKCHRPLASGRVPLRTAYKLLGFLIILSFIIAFEISHELVAILLGYLSVNFFYNHWGKRRRGIDVFCIASGFMLRVLAGTIGVGIPLSLWLTAAATLLSLFIALSKRCLEKQLKLEHETRIVLKKYKKTTLNIALILTGLISFIVYLIYIDVARENSIVFLLTLPFAAFGLVRFVWLTTHESEHDDTIYLFMNDRLSCVNFIFFIIMTGITLIK